MHDDRNRSRDASFSLASAIAAVEHEIAQSRASAAALRDPTPPPASSSSSYVFRREVPVDSASYSHYSASNDHRHQQQQQQQHQQQQQGHHSRFRKTSSDGDIVISPSDDYASSLDHAERHYMLTGELSSITDVISAVTLQARTIQKLQQAVTDLEAAKLQQQQNDVPQSPGRWGEIKRSLAAKSSCAEVEELRAKIKELEEKLMRATEPQFSSSTSRREFYGGAANTGDTYNHGGGGGVSPLQMDSPLSRRDLAGSDGPLQEVIGRVVDSIVKPMITSVRSELKSDLASMMDGRTTLTNDNTAAISSDQTSHLAASPVSWLKSKLGDVSAYEEKVDQLQKKYDQLSELLNKQERHPNSQILHQKSSSVLPIDGLTRQASRPSSPQAVTAHVEFVESRLEGIMRRVEDLESNFDVMRVQIESEVTKRVSFAVAEQLDASEKRRAEDFILLSERISFIEQEVQSLKESKSEKLNASTSAALESITTNISQLEQAVYDEKSSMQSRMDTLVNKTAQLTNEIKDIEQSERSLHGRLDLHIQSLENLRKQIKIANIVDPLGETLGSSGRKAGSDLAASRTNSIENQLEMMRDHLNEKVDTSILEELMRHLATRDELRRIIDSISSLRGQFEEYVMEAEKEHVTIKDDIIGDIYPALKESLSKQRHEVLSSVREELDKFKDISAVNGNASFGAGSGGELKKLASNIRHGMMEHLNQRMKDLAQDLQARLDKLKRDFNELRSQKLEQSRKRSASPRPGNNIDNFDDGDEVRPFVERQPSAYSATEVQRMADRLTRDFDEKLYLLCSDLTACKAAFSAAARQPFYRCALWLWKSNTLVLGSAVPWNFETTNTDPDNFRWEADQSYVRVMEAGLYEICFAFFTKSKPSVQLVVNGESVLSAINSPTYVVHHPSGYVCNGDGQIEPGTVTGLSLIDYMALPAKSTLSLHYHGARKGMVGHGFLGLRKLQ